MWRFFIGAICVIAMGCHGTPRHATPSEFAAAQVAEAAAEQATGELGAENTPPQTPLQLASHRDAAAANPQDAGSSRQSPPSEPEPAPLPPVAGASASESAPDDEPSGQRSPTELRPTEPPPAELPPPPGEAGSGDPGAERASPTLDEVIRSVYRRYPPLITARYDRGIASAEQLAAAGEFDLKLKAATENSPTGFYETYRQSIDFIQPSYHGGATFAGYRIGRGHFEPWYKERQTNDGGEFKAGFAVPLSRNRRIDPRRAELWRTAYGRKLVEPEIQAQLIGFIQDASYAYWDWVAAGAKYEIAQRVLRLAEARSERIRRQVEAGALDPPELTDNLRLVAERRSNLAGAARALQQAAVELSLYYRGPDGHPRLPDPESLPEFPEPEPISGEQVARDSRRALQQRPEIAVLDLVLRQLEVDYAEAHNEFRPSIDAVMSGSQDVGRPTSPKNDKGQFELDASIYLDVPVQRRKARGKMRAVRGKIAQTHAKRRFTEDKIVADVQAAYAGLVAAAEQLDQARQALTYSEDLARRERRMFELGASDLLSVTLREQYAAGAAEKVVDALRLYFQSRADYRAALAEDDLP